MMPTRRALRWVHTRLERLHGARPWPRARESVLDGLVATILSQNTTDANSTRAFESLVARFQTWDDARVARVDRIERAIRVGGLARTKARRIRQILGHIHGTRGETSLEHLRRRSTAQIKSELADLPGIGPKTISCLLLFTLRRPDFPVDTHVHRLAQRLGWVPDGWSAERTYEALGEVVPDDLAYSLHVLLVRHGRVVCRARQPDCDRCPLAPRCRVGIARGVAGE